MASRIKKMLNTINNSSSTIENKIQSKPNNNFDRTNFFNGLVYKDIMAVENKELNVHKKSEFSRDTTYWLPPYMVLNKKTSFTVSDVSDIITYQKSSCSRELFKRSSIESDKKTSSSDLECTNVVIVDELTQIGKSGFLKMPKNNNKKMIEKRNRVYGKGTAKKDGRGSGCPKHKTSDDVMANFDKFIQQLPAKVLSSPLGQNMNLYYSKKFSSYNCTIYESGTQNFYAYLWGEINGKRGCNEIVTYSVHASIERFVKDKTVRASSEWATLIRNARINPKPIEVKQLAYLDFYDWKYEADNCNILLKVLEDV
ncbi:Uncharacterized protein FWK35_00033649, partial [Aphis craccivora]